MLLSCFTLFGCSSGGGTGISAKNISSSVEVMDVVTVEDQAKHEILATPTTFLLQGEESEGAWTRSRFFFETYTSGTFKISALAMTSDESAGTPFRYTVRRTPQGVRGETYQVACIPATPQGITAEQRTKADLNAKNLARFLKSGYLEVSLLEK